MEHMGVKLDSPEQYSADAKWLWPRVGLFVQHLMSIVAVMLMNFLKTYSLLDFRFYLYLL